MKPKTADAIIEWMEDNRSIQGHHPLRFMSKFLDFVNSLVSEDEGCPCGNMPVGAVLVRLTEQGYLEGTKTEIAKRKIEEYSQPSVQRTRPEKERFTIPDLRNWLDSKEGEQLDKENFFDAVRNDPEMTESMRKRWLALEPPSSKEGEG